MVGVCLLLATVLPFSELDYRVVADYDFNELTNTGGNSIDITANFSALVPGFSGDKIYIPAKTNGILQISSSSAIGRLEYSTNETFNVDRMYVFARKPVASPDLWLMYADSVHDGATNNICVFDLTNEFEWYCVELNGLDADETLVLHQNLSISSSRRIWIDRIIFARERKHGFYFIIR